MSRLITASLFLAVDGLKVLFAMIKRVSLPLTTAKQPNVSLAVSAHLDDVTCHLHDP